MNSTHTQISTSQIDRLNDAAWAINRTDPRKSADMALEALTLAEDTAYTFGQAFALKTIGACYVWTSRNEEAVDYCLQAISLFKELQDKKNEAQANYNLACNFFYLSDYDTALEYYTQCYKLYAEISDEAGIAEGLNGLGSLYYTIEQNDKALDVLKQSLTLCRKNNNEATMVRVLDGLGETYYNLKEYETALTYYNECVDACRRLGDTKHVEAFALDGLGRTYAGLSDLEKAVFHYNKSLEIRKELGFKVGVANTLTNIGALYLAQHKYPEAIQYLEDAYSLSIEINSKECAYKASEKLATVYELQQDAKQALHYYKVFHLSKEDVRNDRTKQLVRSVDLQHKILKSNTEKLLLEEKNRELETHSHNLVLMSQIGQQIISLRSVEQIVDAVYSHVNSLMDATGFGIGLYKSDTEEVVFPLYIEGEDKFTDVRFQLEDKERLAVHCFENKKEILINDFDAEISKYIRNYKAPIAGRSVASIIYLPLLVKEKTMGVITVQSFNKQAYTTYHANILRNLGTFAAIALENAQLYEMQENLVQERTRELFTKKEEIEKAYLNNKLLSEIGQQLTSTLNFEEIFSKLHHYVNQLMDAACFGVRIYHPDKHAVEYKYEYENGVRDTEPIFVPMDDHDNFSVWCIEHRREIFISDIVHDYKKYTNQIRVVTGDMPHSLIFYPIMIGDRVLGVITIQSFQKFAYNEYHLDILKTLASYTAIALENANLYETMEEKVKARTEEVNRQKAIIEDKNKDITDSIRYAKKIQQAIMPDESLFSENFAESYILYKPKDIVSGDFYWFDKISDDLVLFAVADCTGHGVPGAFMSLICNNLMNIVIHDNNISSPGAALTLLDRKLREHLSKSSDNAANDGMDVAICAYYKSTNILHFSGAQRPLLIIRDGELLEYKPTKLSIGGHMKEDKTFVNHEIQLQAGDNVYIFTDGYADQFGEKSGKKYKYKNLQRLITSVADQPMADQKQALSDTFDAWKGRLEQVDDVCVIGVRI
ncbi:MAG: tetratricopeptide repeat protein [Bacteroidetes bacterium]|nr:tetratricopeptide repeat protein [Bacteroidota bacterium]